MAIRRVPPPTDRPNVPPLTQTDAEGRVYRRDDQVTEEIRRALHIEPEKWPALARVDGDAMSEECLVHLIRHLHRQHESTVLGTLSKILFDRCQIALRPYARGFDTETARDFYSDVYADLIDALLDLDEPRADFFEVRFAMALRRRAIDVRKKYSAYWRRIDLDQDPAEILDQSITAISDGDGREISEVVRRLTNDKLLRNVPEPQRSAFVLYHAYEFTHQELATHFRRSVSTIRSWLRRVDDLLAKERGDGDG